MDDAGRQMLSASKDSLLKEEAKWAKARPRKKRSKKTT